MVGNIKDVDLAFVKHYLQIEPEFTDDDMELDMMIIVAKDYLIERCGLTDTEFFERNTLLLPWLLLVQEMYGNKQATVNSHSKINFILDRFIAINIKY